MRGQRSALSRREALILQCLINHPWLLHEHLEEVAALELAHPEAHKLRAGIIAAFANDHHQVSEATEPAGKMRADLEASGFSPILQRLDRAITTGAVWGARSGAAREDVLSTWRQLVALHRQWHSLLRELKDAGVRRAIHRSQSCVVAGREGQDGGSRWHGSPDRRFWRALGPVPAERLSKK